MSGDEPQHKAKDTRFKKGQSGNPCGRPKGSGTMVGDLVAELSKTIEVTERGRTRKITKRQALLMALSTAGIKGDSKAASLLMTWHNKLIDSAPEAVAELRISSDEQKIIDEYLERQVEIRLANRKENM